MTEYPLINKDKTIAGWLVFTEEKIRWVKCEFGFPASIEILKALRSMKK